MNYMLSYLDNPALESLVRLKSKILAQPTLPRPFYDVVDSNYHLETGPIHIAYFGSFYGTRNMGEIFDALATLNRSEQEVIQLHIFTQQKDQIINSSKYQDIRNMIKVNDYVDYLEFLNLCSRFNCLLVNDATTLEKDKKNPYLPSKLSDYLGSGAVIWAMYEEGSPMSEICRSGKILHSSKIGHHDEHVRVIYELIGKYSKLIANKGQMLEEIA